MFKTLYRSVGAAARDESEPAAKSQLRYLEHRAASGATLHSLGANAGMIYRSAVHMHPDESSPVKGRTVVWAKFIWAGINLSADDLPKIGDLSPCPVSIDRLSG